MQNYGMGDAEYMDLLEQVGNRNAIQSAPTYNTGLSPAAAASASSAYNNSVSGLGLNQAGQYSPSLAADAVSDYDNLIRGVAARNTEQLGQGAQQVGKGTKVAAGAGAAIAGLSALLNFLDAQKKGGAKDAYRREADRAARRGTRIAASQGLRGGASVAAGQAAASQLDSASAAAEAREREQQFRAIGNSIQTLILLGSILSGNPIGLLGLAGLQGGTEAGARLGPKIFG